MDYKASTKLMGVLLLISSMVSAFCLYNMAVVFATGKLPYGLKPLIPEEDKNKKESEAEKVVKETTKELLKKKLEDPGEGYMNRINEKMVRELYKRLRKMEEKISEEREKVAEEQKSATETQKQAEKMQTELETYRDKIKSLLTAMNEKEIANIRKITQLIEGLEMEAAIKLFKTYNKDKAARILYYMNPKFSKQMIQTMLDNAKTEMDKDDIRDITERMQLLTEEIKIK